MKIRNESEIFTPYGIAKIEEIKDCKFVCETCISENNEWVDSPVAIFYSKTLHPVSNSNYFGVYILPKPLFNAPDEDQIMITSAQTAVGETITGIIADDGDIIYSRYRHDYRVSDDGSVFIDGGRDYVRSGAYPKEAFVNMVIEGGELKIQNKEEE